MYRQTKAYILQEAIAYVNQLQERVKELEMQNQKINNVYSTMIKKKLHDSTTCESNLVGCWFYDELVLPNVITRVSKKSAMIVSNVREKVKWYCAL